jgi:putative ABC transport system permease protein
MSFVASWRAALRVARRETRRTRGRSVLVTAMLALPVLALAFAAATSDMLALTGTEQADRRMGTADARISWPFHQPVQQMPDPSDGVVNIGEGRIEPDPDDEAFRPGTEEELLDALPGSTALPVRRGTTMVRTPNGLGQPDAVMADATSPLVGGFIDVLDGRAPATSTEVALTKQAMAWLDVRVGEAITVVAGDTTRRSTVVGEVEFPSLLDRVLLFGYSPDDDAVREWFSVREDSWLVDTPQPLTWDRIRELNDLGLVVASRAVFEHPPADEEVPLLATWGSAGRAAQDIALGVLVSGLALLEVVLLAGPAFAISARRRQRQLALVAANGGTPAHVRRIVLADGVVIGVLGAIAGITLGVAGAFLARPWIEENIAHERAGGYRVYPEALVVVAALAVLAGVLAALVPAFITARQNVVASLAGRRGVSRSRKRWIAVGAVMIGIGGAVTYAGAMVSDTTGILSGLIVGELGLVLCTPALVGLAARLGRVVPLAPRIALRDAARNRAAAAPAISAVMAAVAGSVALGMYFDSREAHDRATHFQTAPTGTVMAEFGYGDPERPPALAAIEQALRSTLPVSDLYRVGSVQCPAGSPPEASCAVQVLPGDACPQLAAIEAGQELTRADRVAAGENPDCDWRDQFGGGSVRVDDGAAVAALTGASGEDLRRAQEALAAGGVVVRSPARITNGEVRFAVVRPDPDAATDLGASTDPDAEWTVGPGGMYVPQGHTVTEITVPGYLLTTGIGPGPSILSPAAVVELGLTSQTSMIIGSGTRLPESAEIEQAVAALGPLQSGLSVEVGFTGDVDEILLVLLAASALITVGAAAVGTALAAADSRQDLSTLATVGASPRLRRGLSVSQAWVIAGLGSILGALAGMAAGAAVLTAAGQQWGDVLWPSIGPPPPVMPWLTLLITLIAVPAVAILGAGMLTRSRLPIERRL